MSIYTESEEKRRMALSPARASSSEEETFRGHYKIMRTLGCGTFGKVKLACHLLTETQVAVKIVPKARKTLALLASEIEILKSLNHPNIIQLFHLIDTNSKTYIVMEYESGGYLMKRVVQVGHLEEKLSQKMFKQMVDALQYCHGKLIAHRDLKPANILVDRNENIKLSDFGLAIKLNPGEKKKGFYGTPPYCAPEVFGTKEYDSLASDIWSLGVILYFMVTGRHPFEGNTYKELKSEVLTGKYAIRFHLSPELWDVIHKMLNGDPKKRPKIDDITGFQWLGDSEEVSADPSEEIVPSLSNSKVIMIMGILGRSTKEVKEVLRQRKFNYQMATYLMLRRQLHWRNIFEKQVGRCQKRADLPTSLSSLRRVLSAPVLPTLPTFHELPRTDRKGRRHTLPFTLSVLKKTLPQKPFLQHGLLASQAVSREVSSISQDTTWSTTSSGSTSKTSTQSSQDVSGASTPQLHGHRRSDDISERSFSGEKT